MSGVTAGLRNLLGRLVPYKVDFEHTDYASSNDHVESMDLAHADVISSQLKVGLANQAGVYRLVGDAFETEQILDLHHIVIDVDLPVHVVESSTPGHHHLYVELEHPVSTEAYFEWLEASAKIGLIEWGYYEAFKARGFSCVRLPWVEKGDNPNVGLVSPSSTGVMPPQEWEAPVPFPTDPNAPVPTENLGGLFD